MEKNSLQGIRSFFSIDTSVADWIVDTTQLSDPAFKSLQRFIDIYGYKPGDKQVLSAVGLQDLRYMLADEPVKIAPGGSAPNTLYTLGRLLHLTGFCSDLLTVVGESGRRVGELDPVKRADGLIRQSYAEAGIRMILSEQDMSAKIEKLGEKPISATSYIFNGGFIKNRIITTEPGNVGRFITQEDIKEDIIGKNDAVFLGGSTWKKFGFGVTDEILKHRWALDKPLVLALPTNAFFARDNKEFFQKVVPSANVIVSNIEELASVYHESGELPKPPDWETEKKILEKFQRALIEGQKNILEDQERNTGRRFREIYQVAFITREDRGAAVLTPGGITPIAPQQPLHIKNTLGAGDTSYAGFLLGLMIGLSPEKAGELGVYLATQKLQIDEPRLPSPLGLIREDHPKVVDEMRKVYPIHLIRSKAEPGALGAYASL